MTIFFLNGRFLKTNLKVQNELVVFPKMKRSFLKTIDRRKNDRFQKRLTTLITHAHFVCIAHAHYCVAEAQSA